MIDTLYVFVHLIKKCVVLSVSLTQRFTQSGPDIYITLLMSFVTHGLSRVPMCSCDKPHGYINVLYWTRHFLYNTWKYTFISILFDSLNLEKVKKKIIVVKNLQYRYFIMTVFKRCSLVNFCGQNCHEIQLCSGFRWPNSLILWIIAVFLSHINASMCFLFYTSSVAFWTSF